MGENLLLSIDLSMRSAGAVILDSNGVLIDQLLVPTTKEEVDNEELLIYMEDCLVSFAARHKGLTSMVIEGLSFGSKSANADLIAGNWWNIRRAMRVAFPHINIGRIPVTTWRSRVIDLTKGNKAALQKKFGKDYLKIAVMHQVPAHVLQQFVDYRDSIQHWPHKYPPSKKREAIYDLCDAYWLGRYRLSLAYA